MDFNNYEIPKSYSCKYKVTSRDIRQFKKFWSDELVKLNKMNDLSSNTIKLIHKSMMDCFWEAKKLSKETYTPSKYKNNIYINKG
ncbi:hypothetical protein [Clostridium culturomicium]|uniref:hypothetical protein n=1 Tax=Clostridium culturomicium TaxID=1499683 RepID=UPI00058D6B16|nr:hypothetical protein [Clostridium culturomicium]